MSTPQSSCSIPLGFITIFVAVLSFISHGPTRARAESTGEGSVVGDNIEAIVRYDSPPAHGDTSCSWRPALVITAGAPNASGAISVRTRNGVTESLYARVCGNAMNGYYWLRNDAAPRAAESTSSRMSRLVNMLLTRTAPPMDKMVVNVGTWFWVPKYAWKPISVTAYIPTSVGTISVTTTATPKTLIYSPGDGNDSVSCAGPGAPWKESYGDTATTECMYTYRSASHARANNSFNARFTVQWRVTWKSNLGLGGTLPSIRTGLTSPVKVHELQAIAQ